MRADFFFVQFPVDAREGAREERVQGDELTGIRGRRLHRNRFELNRLRQMLYGGTAERESLRRGDDKLAGFQTAGADHEHD